MIKSFVATVTLFQYMYTYYGKRCVWVDCILNCFMLSSLPFFPFFLPLCCPYTSLHCYYLLLVNARAFTHMLLS